MCASRSEGLEAGSFISGGREGVWKGRGYVVYIIIVLGSNVSRQFYGFTLKRADSLGSRFCLLNHVSVSPQVHHDK